MMDFRPGLVEYIRAQARPVEKFSHQERLYHLTRQIGAGLVYDDDIVFAAAWMHDIGVFIGHRPEFLAELEKWDLIAYAEKTVPGILLVHGFPGEKIPAVMEVIRHHQPAGKPSTMEGVLVRDADILEQLGAAGILRTACKVGRDTRFQVFPDALEALQRSADTLPDQLRLPASQALAANRLRILNLFLEEARHEGCFHRG